MRVLVTGATGFLGSSVTRRLVTEGHAVGVLARGESRLDTLQDLLPRIAVHRHDGSYASLLAAIRATKPEAVVHLASLFLMQHQAQDVARLVESNLGFPVQLLEAMCQEGVGQLINTGTSWQHWRNENGNPVNLYAASKQAFESLLAYYVEAKGLKAITLKLFDTYGPGDTRPKLFSLLRRSTKTGELLRMSPGEQQLDFVFVDDVVEAYALALRRVSQVSRHECHAVSNPPRLGLRKVAAIYADVVGRPANIEWGGLPYRLREVMLPWSDYSLLPGWQANVALGEGIARMERDPSIGGLLAGQDG